MKRKLLNFASVSLIVLATLLSLSWAGVELAVYYGNNNIYSNAFFKPIYNTIMFLENTTLLGIFVVISTASIAFVIIGYGIFAAYENAKKLKYMDAIDYQVDKNAAFYDKTYDDTTPVSAYDQERDEELELRVKYDIALDK